MEGLCYHDMCHLWIKSYTSQTFIILLFEIVFDYHTTPDAYSSNLLLKYYWRLIKNLQVAVVSILYRLY